MKINIENSSEILEKYQYLLLKTVNLFPIFERDEALDEAREVLIELINSYDPSKGSFGGYVKYMLYYHFLDKCKNPKIYSYNDLDPTGEEILNSIESSVDIEKELLEREKYEELFKAIDSLKEKEKKVIYMKYFQNKSHSEIGCALNLAPKTITNIHYKIIQNLRKELKR